MVCGCENEINIQQPINEVESMIVENRFVLYAGHHVVIALVFDLVGGFTLDVQHADETGLAVPGQFLAGMEVEAQVACGVLLIEGDTHG